MQNSRTLCTLVIKLIAGMVLLAPTFAIADAYPPAPGTGTSSPGNLLKVFADSPPLEPGQYETSDLARIFPAFRHKPYDQAGFNPVFLPFQYDDPGNQGDPNEALAFDALMSFDLDWAPANYCTRHAFFISQHDSREQAMVQGGYDPTVITALVARWRGTHAIGGTIIRRPNGYEGTLQIFSGDGKLVREQAFNGPRSYWDLLGDMDVDAMTFFDSKPATALAAFLHQPRCAKMESLAEFGSTAFLSQKSDAIEEIYQKILQADPDFATVRAWRANQRYVYIGRNESDRMSELGIALKSRLDPSALWDFSPRDCPDPDLVKIFHARFDEAARMVSEDNSSIIAMRLYDDYYGAQTEEEIAQRGLKIAANFPNSRHLIRAVEWHLSDPWLSASMLVSTFQDRFLPGFDDTEDLRFHLAYWAVRTGRDDVAMQMLSMIGEHNYPRVSCLLTEALTRSGRFDEAEKSYGLIDPIVAKDFMRWTAPYPCFAAAVLGNKPLLDQVMHEQHAFLAPAGSDKVFEGFQELHSGEPCQPLPPDAGLKGIAFPVLWQALFDASVDASRGQSQHHPFMMQCNYEWPTFRLLWIAEDDYQRRDPSADAPAFYEFLHWMYGDDPWVKKAVADFHDRGGIGVAIDVRALRADMSQPPADAPLSQLDWRHVVTPWRVGACLHQLLIAGNDDEALQIARTYADYEPTDSNSNRRHQMALAMLYRVQQVKEGW